MGNFIKLVIILYVIYYGVMVIFDMFIKKSVAVKGADDGMDFDIEGFQTQEVAMTDEELAIEEKLKKQENTFEDEAEDDEEEPEPVTQDQQGEGVQFGQIEDQGFTVDEFNALLQESHHDTMDFMSRLDAKAEQSNNLV